MTTTAPNDLTTTEFTRESFPDLKHGRLELLNDGNTARIHFESADALVRQAAVGTYYLNDIPASRALPEPGFTTLPTFEAAEKLFYSGWSAGAAKIEAAQRQIERGLGATPQRTMTRAVAGHLPMVPAYLAGEPEAMLTLDTASRPAASLTIGINASISARVSPDRLEAFGGALLSAITAAEAQGISTRLVAMKGTEGGVTRQHLEMLYPLKEAGQPLNLSLMAFVLMHSDFYRRMVLSLTEQVSNTRWANAVSYTYGRPVEVPAGALPGACVLPRPENMPPEPELIADRVIALIEKHVREQGVGLAA